MEQQTIIKLNIGGVVRETTLTSLRSRYGSFLSTMFGETNMTNGMTKPSENNTYFIDADYQDFRHILSLYTVPGLDPIDVPTDMNENKWMCMLNYYDIIGKTADIPNKLVQVAENKFAQMKKKEINDIVYEQIYLQYIVNHPDFVTTKLYGGRLSLFFLKNNEKINCPNINQCIDVAKYLDTHLQRDDPISLGTCHFWRIMIKYSEYGNKIARQYPHLSSNEIEKYCDASTSYDKSPLVGLILEHI